jgi:hypothetical protein
MKNIIAALTVLLTIGSVNAGFNNVSWDNTPWGNNQYQNQSDNGIFGFNGFNFWDPRWYSQEFTNMVNEFDDEFSNNNTPKYGYGYAQKGHNFPVKSN